MPITPIASYYNNEILKELSFSDFDPYFNWVNRGFLLGDGFFTTFLAIDGEVLALYLDEHIHRIIHSFEILAEGSLNSPNFEELKSYILDNILKILSHSKSNSNTKYHRIRITFYRLELEETFGSVFQVMELEANPFNCKPVSAIIYPEIRIHSSKLSQVKTINRLPNVLAEKFALKNKVDKAIFLNSEDHIACAHNANIFIIKDNCLITPPLNEGILGGVMRKTILNLATQNTSPTGLKVLEQTITLKEFISADSIFCTNSIIFISPIHQIILENKVIYTFPTNEIIKQIKEWSLFPYRKMD